MLLGSPAVRAIAQPIDPAPKFIAKLGALSLFDPVLPSVNLIGEFQLGGPWYGQVEGGLILNLDDQLSGLRTRDKRGFRLRPSVRYYYQEQRNRYFMELLVVYRQAKVEIDGQFRVNPPRGPSYNQLVPYTVDSRKFSVFLNVGLFDYVLNDRVVIEMGIGLGAAALDNTYSDIPEHASITSNTSIINAYNPDFEVGVADIRGTGMLYFNIGYVLY